jgi:hypothetical protein
VIFSFRTARASLFFQFGNLALFFTLILLQTARIRHAASRMAPCSYLAFQLKDLFFKLAPYLEIKIIAHLYLPLAFFPHEGLLHFQLLLLSHLYHHLFNTGGHLLLVILLVRSLPISPGMLHYGLQTDPLFWVWVQHFFD